MADIDSLEIQIQADSSTAAESVNSLASALYKAGRAAATAQPEIQDVADALRSLKSAIKMPASFSASAEQIKTLFGSLSEIKMPDISGISQTVSGLSGMTESMKNLKVNKSFETSLENLSLAMAHLNDMGDTSKFADGVTKIEDAINRLNQIKVGQGFINLVNATSKYSDAVQYMNNLSLGASFTESINRVARAAEILHGVDFSGFNNMSDALASIPENVSVSFGSSSELIDNIADSINSIRKSVDSVIESLQNMTASSNSATSAASQAVETANSLLENVQIEDTVSIPDAIGQWFVTGFSEAREYIREFVPDIRNNIRNIGEAMLSIPKYGAAMVKGVVYPLTSVGKAFTTAAQKAGMFFSSIKRIAMYRAIRSMIKAITDGFAEGRKNLYFYSQEVGTDFAKSMDTAATAALYLKNSIGAATAPLTNLLVPMIDRAVDHIVDFINAFNEMTAVLTGAQTWTKAMKYPVQWQDAADDASKAAKKLKSTMLGFDELNVIEPNTTGSKSKMEDAPDYSRMFKEMITDFELPEWLETLSKPIKLAWDNEGKNTIDSLKNTWESILGLVGAVRDSVKEIWGNGTGQKTLELALQIVQNISGTIGAIADKFTKAWKEAGTGTAILQNVWDTVNNLLTLFRDLWASAKEWAEKLDFSPLLKGIKGVTGAIKELTDPSSGLYKIIKMIWEKVILPLGKWLIEKGIPAVLRLTTSIVKLAKQVADNLAPKFEKLLNDWLIPIGEWFGKISLDSIGRFTDFIDNLTEFLSGDYDLDIAEKLNDAFTDFKNPAFWMSPGTSIGSSLGQGLIEGLKDVLPKAGEAIKNFFTGKKSNGSHWDSDNPWDNGNVVYAGMYDISYLGGSLGNSQKDQEELGLFDSISQSWNNYIDDWGIGFESIKETWSLGWEEIKKNASDGIDSLEKDWKDYKDDWASGFDSISKTASKKWTSIKDTLKSGWDSLKNKISDFADYWSEYFGNIGQKAYDKWQEIKDTWSNGWGTIKQKVQDFKDDVFRKFTGLKDDVIGKFVSLKDDAIKKWDELKDKLTLDSIIKGIEKTVGTIVDTIKGIWDDGKGGGLKHWKISELIAGLFDDIGDLIKWGDIKNKFLENIEGILNFFGEGINKLLDLMPDFVKEGKGIAANFQIPKISLGRYAEGGIPDTGEVFVARESGAELVGKIGNRTSVANNEQITSAITAAAYSGFVKALKEAGNGNGNGDITVKVNLDGRQIAESVERVQQSKGRPLFSGGVYI